MFHRNISTDRQFSRHHLCIFEWIEPFVNSLVRIRRYKSVSISFRFKRTIIQIIHIRTICIGVNRCYIKINNHRKYCGSCYGKSRSEDINPGKQFILSH